jgi:hypothetical protein
MTRRAIALAILLAGACSTDTAPGLVVTIDSSQVHLPVGGMGSATLNVSYRVGPYAPAAHTFRPNAIQIYDGGTLISNMTVQTPSGFRSTLSPGQSAQAVLTGMGAGDGMDRCGREVQILLRWMGATPTDIGLTMGTATVMCP